MSKRDEFPKPVKRSLAESAGYICSHCGIGTIGPHKTSGKSLKLGKACHITAASPGGPRFDPTMTPEERSSASNGIWLCLKCADMIDKNPEDYSVDLLRTWKSEHELRMKIVLDRAIQLIPQLEISRLSDIADDAHLNVNDIKRIFYYKDSEVNATKLWEAGFNKRVIPQVLSDLEKAKNNNNLRLIQYVNAYLDSGLSGVPKPWRSFIAGFPIIGQDISSPSLTMIAKLANEYRPYLSKSARDFYHKKVRKLLVRILAELQSFLNDAAVAGWFPLIVNVYPSLKWWQDPYRVYTKGISFRYEDALLSGNWTIGVPQAVAEYFDDVNKTWSGVLFDMISRLPDPDKQKGKLLPRFNLRDAIYLWCSTPPTGFTTPFNKITRKAINSSDHTIAGLYKSISEHLDSQPDAF